MAGRGIGVALSPLSVDGDAEHDASSNDCRMANFVAAVMATEVFRVCFGAPPASPHPARRTPPSLTGGQWYLRTRAWEIPYSCLCAGAPSLIPARTACSIIPFPLGRPITHWVPRDQICTFILPYSESRDTYIAAAPRHWLPDTSKPSIYMFHLRL